MNKSVQAAIILATGLAAMQATPVHAQSASERTGPNIVGEAVNTGSVADVMRAIQAQEVTIQTTPQSGAQPGAHQAPQSAPQRDRGGEVGPQSSERSGPNILGDASSTAVRTAAGGTALAPRPGAPAAPQAQEREFPFAEPGTPAAAEFCGRRCQSI